LGLQNRNVTSEFGWQGKFKLQFQYDELQRNRSDSFQTPYQGEGTNTLTLPNSWLVPLVPRISSTAANARGLSPDVTSSSIIDTTNPAGPLLSPTVPQQTAASNIQGTDLPLFHNVNLYTNRKTYEGGFSYFITPELEFTAKANHMNRDGYKPMGFETKGITGDRVSILPDLINQTTDQYNANLNFTGEKAFMQVGYYGSLFYNNTNSMSWRDWGPSATGLSGTPSQTRFDRISSAPDNQFHQFTMNGGYTFSPKTKLVLGGSYAQSTQNETFLTDSSIRLAPASSLHGLIETSTFNIKLTHKPTKDLGFALGYKYDNRDNKTSVNTYAFYASGEPSTNAANTAFVNALGVGALGSNININANMPYSKLSNQITLNGNYHVAKNHWLNAGYEWEQLDRSCTGSWYNCVNAPKSNEHTGKFQWRSNLFPSINTKFDYAFSRRLVNYDENSWLSMVPMANVVADANAGVAGVQPALLPNGQPASAYSTMLYYGLNGYGPVAGYTPIVANSALSTFFALNNALAPATYGNRDRITELQGMRRFNMADRDRHKLRTSINWQTTQRLSFQGGFEFSNDDYFNSAYGLQSSREWDFNLDASYAVSDSLSANVFYTHQNQLSKTAGNTYTANSNTANANGATQLVGSGACNSYTTLLQRNLNNKLDPCNNWFADMQNEVDVFGLSLSKNGLMHGKLSLSGNFVFSLANTYTDVKGGNYANNPRLSVGSPPTSTAAFYIPAKNLPPVVTDTFDISLTAQYAIDKSSSIRALYSYMRMNSRDYAYDGMQPGGLAAVLPTYETAPVYSVHAVGLAYTYSFQ
jgi:MtrB/PioB family decaheme-associated outer membrane protein